MIVFRIEKLAAVGGLWRLLAPFGTLWHPGQYDIIIMAEPTMESAWAVLHTKEDTKSH